LNLENFRKNALTLGAISALNSAEGASFVLGAVLFDVFHWMSALGVMPLPVP
jgi:hypothetical protein